MQNGTLTQTSPELLEALDHTLRLTFGQDAILVDALHTGGGCMVAAIDLSIDGRLCGRQVWLTREGDFEWMVGFYDFALDPEDEGICVSISGHTDYKNGGNTADSPSWVAAQVAGILARLGVTSLQGE